MTDVVAMRQRRETVALAVLIVCFTIGAINHGRDFLSLGWRPYSSAPPLLEVFWTSLILLDAAVVAFLLNGRRRSGLSLAALTMILDVSANAYASFGLAIPGFEVALPLQAAFLGFVLASALLLWPKNSSQN